MALNGDLNTVLYNIVYDRAAPVIRLTNGLYTVVQKDSIVPDETLGTNLLGCVNNGYITYSELISDFKLIGTWRTVNYTYNNETNKWRYVASEQ